MIPIVRWEAHVDWLTLTFKERQPEFERARWIAAEAKAVMTAGCGESSRRDQLLGYFGQWWGPLFVGNRFDSSMVRCSGLASDMLLRIDWPATTKCTRIDLCVTCWYGEDHPSLGAAVLSELLVSREATREGHAKKIAFIDGCGDGDTVYCGSRQSTQFGRLYDKMRESDDPAYINAWRWEVEFKASAARQIFEGVTASPNRVDTIASTVESWWTKRGASRGPGVACLGALRVECPRGETSDVARLTWLATQVKPTVRRLLTTVGEGATLQALGLEGLG
jgi:hypothetical protein